MHGAERNIVYFWLLVFPAKVAHAIKNEGKDVVYLLCFNRADGKTDRPVTKQYVVL